MRSIVIFLACLVSLVSLNTANLYAQNVGGLPWVQPTRSFSSATPLSGNATTNPSPSGFSALSTGTNIAEIVTPEIQALARGLEYDPTRMMIYVHDNIRQVPYFGAKKGAQLTLLEKSGNDFDQCALLVALLRAAGLTAKYDFGVMVMPYESSDHNDMKHWMNTSLPNTNSATTMDFLQHYLQLRGYPTVFPVTNNATLFGIHRVWVRLTLGGTDYNLDPGFKVTERILPFGGFSLSNAMALDTNALLAAAGGTVTNSNSSIQGMTEQTLRDKLRDYTTNLLSNLQTNAPNGSLSDLIGGASITRSTSSAVSGLLFGVATEITVKEWDYIPTDFISSLGVIIGSTNKTWYVPELGGDRLSLTFTSNGVATIWLEDTAALQLNTSSGSNIDVILSASQPYYKWSTNTMVPDAFANQIVTNQYQRTNANYALLYAFEASNDLLQRRMRKLDLYRTTLADDSREVRTETLNVLGLNWMLESAQLERLFAQQMDIGPMSHHRYGRMGQEDSHGYYIDVYMWNSGSMANTGNGLADTNRLKKSVEAFAYFWSALEHGVIEQTQASNVVASSSVKMLQVANAASSNKIYLATSANWTSGNNVRAQLTGYSDLSTMDSLIASQYALLLPQNGSQFLHGTSGWKGYGLAAVCQTNLTVKMLISGGFNGGYIEDPYILFDPFYIADSNWQQPDTFNPSPVLTPQPVGADPVNMADGSFRVAASDLTVGDLEPRGLSFTRSYSSARRNSNVASMAMGWTHGYNFRLSELSAPDAGLGETTPQQMAPMLAATCAALNLYNTTPDVKNWAVTALIAKWGADQLLKNAVSITMGQDTLQFVKQPDGSFTPPANCRFTLTKPGGTYSLQERNANVFSFISSPGRLNSITDPYGQPLLMSYDSSNRVQTVTDWKGRSLTFNYTGSPQRLTSITNNGAGIVVSFGYGTNYSAQGDLISFTDAELKTSTFTYDTNHQIIATIDALGRVVTTNVYDSFGRVITQYSQGNGANVWDLRWTGVENSEIDPAGGKKRFIYDDKMRLVASIDALGNTNRMAYDGQDHLVMAVSPMNETNLFQFDGRHNLIAKFDALGKTNQCLLRHSGSTHQNH